MNVLRRAVSLALYGSAIAVVPGPAAWAQTAPAQGAKTEPSVLEAVTVVGSRRTNASATDTPVPIDIILIPKVAESGGNFDLAQTLQYISPSFNSTRRNWSPYTPGIS